MRENDTVADAIILAAGSSNRMEGVDKVIAKVGGKPVLHHSLKVFNETPLVDRIALVVRADEEPNISQMIASSNYAKRIITTLGGVRRQDSVKAGLDALTDNGATAEFVVVHDGARPFVSEELLLRGMEAAKKSGAAVPGLPLTDTLKRVDNGLVVGTPDRDEFFYAQTPQIFKKEILVAAHETVYSDVTDDAAMVEQAGGLVAMFEGDMDNIKITRPIDLWLSEVIAASRSGKDVDQPEFRHGIAVDGHRLTKGGPLILGGLEIEFDMHLEGHSDGDVLMHAVANAVLGAAGAGDLGSNFPSSDERYAGADSSIFVRNAVERARQDGWQVDFIDAIIIAQRPRLADVREKIEASIRKALGMETSCVNVKVTSNDGMGVIGAGEGIAAEAVATLKRA